jgi:creatinine amidohydrolase
MPKGITIESLSWQEAEPHLNADAIVVIPLGAAAKEHGPHLQLRNDWLIAEHLKDQILEQSEVVVFPTINYSYFPSFVEYPGSVTLSSETSSQMIFEICRSISTFGPIKFYIINTGISTLAPLTHAASNLETNGIHLAFTNFDEALEELSADIAEQEGGSHADEIETSLMLQIAPETVQMKLAGRDFEEGQPGRLTRIRQQGLAYSPSGIWGDATLATKTKGEKIVKCLVEHILNDIEKLRSAPPLIS